MRLIKLQFPLLLLLASQAAHLCYGKTVRGEDPAFAAAYTGADGLFRCLDGLKTIPFSQVNDQYCDCFDGSDEPGSSACPNGRFFCENVGHEPLRLNASMVDDGVCDCCDGSDESSGCPNRCKQMGAEALKSLIAEVAATEAGLEIKAKYISEARGIKKGWEQRLEGVEKEITQQQEVVNEAQGKRDKLQSKESELQEAKRKEEEEAKKRKEEAEAAAAAAGGSAAAAEEQQGESREEGTAQAEEKAVDAEKGAEGAAVEGEEAGGGEAEKEEETPEEIARRVAAQWIPGEKKEEGSKGKKPGWLAAKEAAKKAYDPPTPPAESFDFVDSEEEIYNPIPEEPEEDYNLPGDEGAEEPAPTPAPVVETTEEKEAPAPAPKPDIVDKLPSWAKPYADRALKWGRDLFEKFGGGSKAGPGKEAAAPAEPKSPLDAELEDVKKQLADASGAYSAEGDKLRSLKNERTKLQANLAREYGPEGEFTPLADKCYEAKMDKYIYEVCPFKKSTQKEGGSSTSLGDWGGFGEGHTTMKFTGGAHCWQGPSRSMEVSLLCGSKEELTHVVEPSRCEYHAELTTPAACSAATLKALKERLAAKQALLEGIHDEL